MTFYSLVGILSAVIFLIGDIPYLRNTLKAKTKPHRVTWGIITLLNGIGFANQIASGATNSLWLFGAATLMTGLIFLASLRYGTGGQSRSDIICLTLSLIGVGLWIGFKSPVYSIITTLFVDVIALWPSFSKAKKDPKSETRISWLVGAISAALATISVGKLDWKLLVLPSFSVILQAYMSYLLYTNPGQHSHTSHK